MAVLVRELRAVSASLPGGFGLSPDSIEGTDPRIEASDQLVVFSFCSDICGVRAVQICAVGMGQHEAIFLGLSFDYVHPLEGVPFTVASGVESSCLLWPVLLRIH